MFSYSEAYAATLAYFDGDELASDVFLKKYALTDSEGNLLEKTPTDMHHRLAKEFARIEANYPHPLTEEEIFSLLDGFKYIVPQGGPMSGIGNHYQNISLGNCFVLDTSNRDSYGGILTTDQELAQIYKRRGGCGLDISFLRPKGMPTSNASKTTDGIAGFMERFSNTTREACQDGRRGALMITISVEHPEIKTFINIKRDLKKVTGANISIRLTDKFMQAVKNNTDFVLQWPVESANPVVTEKIDAVELWNEIISAAHTNGEPGLLFWDNVINNGPADCYGEFRSVSTNPCVTGDTLIAVADGRGSLPIKQLADEGEDVPVYSQNNKGSIVIKTIRNPRLTGIDEPVLKITLENGHTLRCTKNHKFILGDKSEKQARELIRGDSLHIATRESASIKDVFPEINATSQQNHKVISVESDGYADVYNGTVDDNHNYYCGGWQEGEKKQIYVCTKNCGEIPLSGRDSCRLLLINLTSCVDQPFTSEATFNFKLLSEISHKSMRLMDDLVSLELEAIDKILNKISIDPESNEIKAVEKNLWMGVKESCERGRRTGLGITGLGDAMAYMGLTYGSDKSIKLTEKIYQTLEVGAWTSSCEMARDRGAFPAFDREIEVNHGFIQHVLNSDENLLSLYSNYGRRNIALTTTSPAGSVSLLTQTTSGIEPVFQTSYKRRKKTNNETGVKDELGDFWEVFEVNHPGLVKWSKVTGNKDIEESPYFNATSDKIDWLARVKLQAAAQAFVDHSISSTINLPEDATVDEVKQIYMSGWEAGLKGLTIYRDKCRDGVLVTDKESQQQQPQVLLTHSAPRRPKDLPCEIFQTSVKGEKWTILIGKMGDSLYEIFAGESRYVQIPKAVKEGRIIKRVEDGQRSYDLHYGDTEDETVIRELTTVFENPNYGSLTRMISLSLRHGTPVQYVVEQLGKDTANTDLYSFNRVVARILKNYIKDGTKTNKKCESCKQQTLKYSDGCCSCYSCGWSKCS